ncbi:MAG: hypothetical protein WA916_08980 [Arcobacter sp.]|uniref:hypothetical protein n=1 Tax=Arcobacter sp. TaxID=1872629 RepID=UPI003C73ACAF
MRCDWEVAIVNLFHLAVSNSFGGVHIEYLLVKDYCARYELDEIETMMVLKQTTSVFNTK